MFVSRFQLTDPHTFTSLVEIFVRASLLQFRDLVEHLNLWPEHPNEGEREEGFASLLWQLSSPPLWPPRTFYSLRAPKVPVEIASLGEIYESVRYTTLHMTSGRDAPVQGVYARPPMSSGVRCWPYNQDQVLLDLDRLGQKALEQCLDFWDQKSLKIALGKLWHIQERISQGKLSPSDLPDASLPGEAFRKSFVSLGG